MHKTEKKYWQNGYEKRGTFRSLTLSAGRIGVMITNSIKAGVISVYMLTGSGE